MTGLLVGAAIGLVIAIGIGLWRTPRIYQQQLEQFEPEIPKWVNQGNRAVIGTYDEILEAIWQETNFEMWELEMGDR